MTSLSATLTDEAEACRHTATVVDAEDVYMYNWQRPSDVYRERLAARRQELREQDLDADDELLAEWFALLAEVDRLVREEHLLGDNLTIRSCSYYKGVLLARQAELRKVDLQSNHALLIEWYALIKELDVVVKQQAIAERVVRQRAKPVDTRIRDGELQPCNRITVQVPGGTAYTAVSRRRPRAKAQASSESEHAPVEATQGSSVSVPPTPNDSHVTNVSMRIQEQDNQSRSNSQENGAHSGSCHDEHSDDTTGKVDGDDDDVIAAFDAEIAGTGDNLKDEMAEQPTMSLTLEDYALLPPDERFQTLTTLIPTTSTLLGTPMGAEPETSLNATQRFNEEGYRLPLCIQCSAFVCYTVEIPCCSPREV